MPWPRSESRGTRAEPGSRGYPPVIRSQCGRKEALLAGQLLGQGLVEVAPALRVGIGEEADGTVAVVVPARIVEDRVETHALDGQARLQRRANLRRDIEQPRGAA